MQGGAVREALAFNWLAGQGSLYYLRRGAPAPAQRRLVGSGGGAGDAGSVHAAGLHVGGWYDIFGQGTLDAFTALQEHGGSGAVGRQRLVMGPWTHNRVFETRAARSTTRATPGSTCSI